MLGRARSAPLTTISPLSMTSPRWADIAVSDDDLSDVELYGTQLPTVLEDSYRSKPDSALEDSKTGVNAAMKALTPHSHPKVHEDSPKDFGFLLQGRRQCADLELAVLEIDNSDAISEVGSQISSSTFSSPDKLPSKVPRSKQNQNQNQNQKRRKPSGQVTRQNPIQRKRGRVSPGHAGTLGNKSRCISDSMSEKSDPPLTEDHDSLDSASVGDMSCSVCESDRSLLPEATEEEWQRREDYRAKALDLGKQTAAYQRFCAAVPEDERSLDSCIIRTPNPFDRTISKRKWKEIVHEWRKQLWMHFGDESQRKKGEETAEASPTIEQQGEPEAV